MFHVLPCAGGREEFSYFGESRKIPRSYFVAWAGATDTKRKPARVSRAFRSHLNESTISPASERRRAEHTWLKKRDASGSPTLRTTEGGLRLELVGKIIERADGASK